ncbi:hypothetical protein HYH03_015948 [Edaphochlamys debaryana]|uniref:Uncharacterized protein n=1 Tax=Edaphochlamys debaryana TaxID=47281 RepID=A0A835XM30_9CHLO|nr:hypothetical protein HYH03_015948 [Edaphochlamys debaryana]|eukprot:KAG2485273.1 hypothetical protein HYH03_015948 [Edaphochlamys debaryana]
MLLRAPNGGYVFASDDGRLWASSKRDRLRLDMAAAAHGPAAFLFSLCHWHGSTTTLETSSGRIELALAQQEADGRYGSAGPIVHGPYTKPDNAGDALPYIFTSYADTTAVHRIAIYAHHGGDHAWARGLQGACRRPPPQAPSAFPRPLARVLARAHSRGGRAHARAKTGTAPAVRLAPRNAVVALSGPPYAWVVPTLIGDAWLPLLGVGGVVTMGLLLARRGLHGSTWVT